MDIIRTEDRAISTDMVKYKNSEELKEVFRGGPKTEKKKSENKKLKKKLHDIEEHNESLTKLMHEKSNEIIELKKSINSLSEVINSVPMSELRNNSSIASTKLLELNKKNRQLRAELASTKNRLARKDQQVQQLEKILKKEQEKCCNKTENCQNSNSCIEEMQNKLSTLQQKLFETRNKNVELSAQLKLAHKCLQQEIGENFNLNLLASQPISSWRGRAQQILHLQQKVKELQERLDDNKECGINNKTSNTSLGSNERPFVRKTEIQRRAKVELLEKEISNLKSELNEHRCKILALKVRNKTLNDVIINYKLKASTLEEEKGFNNLNVAAVNDRLNEQKTYYEQILDENSRKTENFLKEIQELEINREHLEEKIRDLEDLLSKKDVSIDELNLLVRKLERDLKAIAGDFLFSCRELRKEEFITILDSLEAEKNSLLELNKTLNERLKQERLKNDNLYEQVSKQKIRISRLEAKLRDVERELDVQTEKKKRNQRIAEYTASLSTLSSSSSLVSFTFENSCVTNNNISEQQSNEDINDLKNRLELTTEKITMLKEKLDYLTAEKQNDVKTFHEIISNSKNILVEMIKSSSE